MTKTRVESDLLGERPLPLETRHGIHTVRALENFALARRPVHDALARAFGAVKLAAARTNFQLGYLDPSVFDAIEAACIELQDGEIAGEIVVDALQGGAGTSTNMNVNEVLANRALEILGRPHGDYDTVDPFRHLNLHQSTNDTFPTALRVAAILQLRGLERELSLLAESFQRQEQALGAVVKVSRTEFQDAVLITLGREMGAYAEAFSRDRWRVYKCEERLRVVNLGGTAVGTGLGAPREYVFRVVDQLKQVTGLGLARAENLVEATQNSDAYVEVSGILKACASNLLKIAADLRLLSSGPDAGLGEIVLPAVQAGSSMMPGKVNPVVPEAVCQAAIAVIGHDQALTIACSLGSLELNPFVPLIADALLTQIDLLAGACRLLRERCVDGLAADAARCRAQVEGAVATVTALVPAIGYAVAQRLAERARAERRPIRELVIESGLLAEDEFARLTSPESVLRLGTPSEERKR